MTLIEWAEDNNIVVQENGKARIVPNNCPNRADLFHLTDYLVSSSMAGSFWLRPRLTPRVLASV